MTTKMSYRTRSLEPLISRSQLAPVDWYIKHIAGCLASYAARIGEPSLENALIKLCNDVEDYWQLRNWSETYAVRALLVDQPVREEDIDDDIPF